MHDIFSLPRAQIHGSMHLASVRSHNQLHRNGIQLMLREQEAIRPRRNPNAQEIRNCSSNPALLSFTFDRSIRSLWPVRRRQERPMRREVQRLERQRLHEQVPRRAQERAQERREEVNSLLRRMGLVSSKPDAYPRRRVGFCSTPQTLTKTDPSVVTPRALQTNSANRRRLAACRGPWSTSPRYDKYASHRNSLSYYR